MAEDIDKLKKGMRKNLIFGILFVSLGLFFYVRNYQEEANQNKIEQEKLYEAFEAQIYLREIQKYNSTDLEFYNYKNYYIWKSDDTNKYYINSFSQSYATKAEAKNAVDDLYHRQQQYIEQLKNYWKANYETSNFYFEQSHKTPETIDQLEEQLISYFERGDTNINKQLDWNEIKRFQANVYNNFDYENNTIVLEPKQFLINRGGDCDDFAVFSASLLEHFGYTSYIFVVNDYEERNVHAVAGIYIGDEEYDNGFISIENTYFYNPKILKKTTQQVPDGNYVILDYWNVGLPIEGYNDILYIAKIEDAIGSKW